MDVEFINPFIVATRDVFQTMLASDVERGSPELARDHQPQHHISGVIGLTGLACGVVVVSFHRDVAIGITEALAGTPPEMIDEDARDAVGEIANMIAGGAKGRMKELSMTISLPTVITGRNHIIGFPKRVHPISIPFASKWGPFTIQVGMTHAEASSA